MDRTVSNVVQRIVILGTRSLSLEVADLISQDSRLELAGFVENQDKGRCSSPLLSLPVYWVDELDDLAKSHWAVCAFGSTKRAALTAQAEKAGMRFVSVVHSSAQISATSSIGDGSIVNPGVVVASHTHIGRHVLINRGVLVGHHVSIGAHASIMPGANIGGSSTIGEGSFIGMGAIVFDHVSVGKGCVVGAGSLVTKSLPDGVQAMGTPARITKESIDGR